MFQRDDSKRCTGNGLEGQEWTQTACRMVQVRGGVVGVTVVGAGKEVGKATVSSRGWAGRMWTAGTWRGGEKVRSGMSSGASGGTGELGEDWKGAGWGGVGR